MIVFTMLETPHVAIGAAIATKIPNPFISIPLAFLSHFVMERVPHWNPHINTELKTQGKISTRSMQIIWIDALLALGLGSFIAYQALPDVKHAVVIMLASFASILPDLIEFPYFFMKNKNKYLLKILHFQKSIQVDTTPFWGFITQSLTILACLWWIR